MTPQQKNNLAQRALYYRKKAAGQCQRCTNPAEGTFCEPCRVKRVKTPERRHRKAGV